MSSPSDARLALSWSASKISAASKVASKIPVIRGKSDRGLVRKISDFRSQCPVVAVEATGQAAWVHQVLSEIASEIQNPLKLDSLMKPTSFNDISYPI